MGIFNNPDRLAENYGIKIGAGLIVYFLIMKFAGLNKIVELRLLNLFIQSGGIYYALKRFKETHGGKINYFRALITGVSSSTIGSVIFAIFMFLYMTLDPEMMRFIIENEPMGRYLNAYMVSFIVILEGGFSGFLVTFVLINYVGTDEVNS